MNFNASFLNSQDLKNSSNTQELIGLQHRTTYVLPSESSTTSYNAKNDLINIGKNEDQQMMSWGYDVQNNNDNHNISTWDYFMSSVEFNNNNRNKNNVNNVSDDETILLSRGGNMKLMFIDQTDDPRYSAINTRSKLSIKLPGK